MYCAAYREDCKTLVKRMYSGELPVSGDITAEPSVQITLEYQGSIL